MDRIDLSHDGLCEFFEKATEENKTYIGVVLDLGYETNELIVNHKAVFNEKLNYYITMYDIGLEHNHAEGIRIVGFVSGDSLSDLESLYLENLITSNIH